MTENTQKQILEMATELLQKYLPAFLELAK